MSKHWTYTETYVKGLYDQLAISSPEQLNIHKISQQLNIHLIYWDEESQAVKYDNVYFIFLTNGLNKEEEYETFMHELGHLLLHIGRQDNMPKAFRDYQEYKAKQFMLHATVPTFMLEKVIENSTYSPILTIQKAFNVSLSVAKQRYEHYYNRERLNNINKQKYIMQNSVS